MLLTNIDVNKACTTERGNRYLPVVSKDLCPYYHNYNATNYVTIAQIAQWSKLLTSTRFLYGHEFESQTCIIYLFIFFLLLLASFYSCFFFLIRYARFA